MPVYTRKEAPGMRLREQDVDRYLNYARNTHIWMREQLYIPHPTRGRVPFKLYDFQHGVLYYWEAYRYTVCLKPRQMGLSTLVGAKALHTAQFRPYSKVTLVSINQRVASNLLKRIKVMYQHQDEAVRMPIVNGLRGGVGTASSIQFANGSEIEVVPATENAARSDALTLLVLDEAAFQFYAEAIWTSSQPALSTGGQAIILSSAFGQSNWYYDTWKRAETDGAIFPIRLNWRMHPERNDEWYQRESNLLGPKKTAQEIDCDFLTSGYQVFDPVAVRAIEDGLQDAQPYETDMGGAVRYYHPYDPSKLYVVGADIATGGARDFSTFSVMDEYGKEYACGKVKIPISDFAHLLIRVGQRYGDAMLAPEVNSIGEGILSWLESNNYPNIYFHTALITDRDGGRYEASKPGWQTNTRTRQEMIAGLEDDLRHGAVELYNPFFVAESESFVYDHANRAVAEGKGRKSKTSMIEDESRVKTDDMIFAVCIANAVRKTLLYQRRGYAIDLRSGR